MPRLVARPVSRIVALGATVVGLLLVAGPALAAEAGTMPKIGEHDGVIGELSGLAVAAVLGLLLAVITFSMLPARPVEDDDGH